MNQEEIDIWIAETTQDLLHGFRAVGVNMKTIVCETLQEGFVFRQTEPHDLSPAQ